MLAKKVLILSQTFQKISFWKSTTALARGERCRHALRLDTNPHAVATGVDAVALDFTLLTANAGQDPRCLLLALRIGRHDFRWRNECGSGFLDNV